MTTYTATQQQEPFDWNKALDEAIAEPTDEIISRLSDLANDWVTCSCGNQCAAIPRHVNGEPEDDILSDLGMQFCEEVDGACYPAAKHTLSLIEARSAELLKSL